MILAMKCRPQHGCETALSGNGLRQTAVAAPQPSDYCVMIVDDSATSRQVIGRLVERLGFRTVLAADGEEAIRRFGERPCDIVLMDVMMPRLDGYEATRRIKAMMGARWVPVLILSALDREEHLVAGLDAGADDYLLKPINHAVLAAKLRSLVRMLSLQRELEETRRRLQHYHDARENEDALAAEIFDQIMKRPGLADPRLHYWIASAGGFSGDILAATEAVNDNFYVLLADATGHGLAAAISVLPLLTQFYDSAGAGVPLERIIYRINTQLCASLPTGRFVAAAFLCLTADRSGALWLGGMPPALLLDAAGNVMRRIPSMHLPLGVEYFLSDEAAPLTCDCRLPNGAQLLLCSDGLLEARNAAGEPFGEERLKAALASAAPAQRLEAIQQALAQHLGGVPPHDDIAVALIDLPAAQPPA